MGVKRHSGKSMEQIQRENLKKLREKNLERKRREAAEKVRQQNLARMEAQEEGRVQMEADGKKMWPDNMDMTKLKKGSKPKTTRSKSARPTVLNAVVPEAVNIAVPVKTKPAPQDRRKSANPSRHHVENVKLLKRQEMNRKPLIIVSAAIVILILSVILCVNLFPKDGREASADFALFTKSEKKESPDKADSEVIEMEEKIPFEPYCTSDTDPTNLIQYTEINVDGTTLASTSDYKASSIIDFGKGSSYFKLDGISTFRGNNFRDSAVFGTADMTEYTLNDVWSYNTSALSYGDVWWTGSGWTGQPLMAKWPKETKKAMNMHDWAKQDDDLVEVIYACMDGYIYFLDLETGKETREPMYLGYTFKGAGALDPRGYPIMYVGAGYDSNNGTARSFIINLLDCSVMYTFGNNDEFSLRGSLSYFDSSSLVDAETDTLIYPGENGILYLIKLNTQYDENAGTLSIDPGNIVKWHYWGTRSSTSSYWVGMETSAAVYEGYLFIADNGGNLMCLDLNTLQLVWVQDILDDSNSTPVLSEENGKLYLYVSTSFHSGWRSYNTADVPIWKIDAENGDIIWERSYECYTEDALSGGVQSTIALGNNALSDYIYVTVARTGGYSDGVLTCINKSTGEVVWEHEAFYAWSSPVCVYDSEGNGKVLYCTCGGSMYLLEGLTGEVLDTMDLVDGEGAVEASPAVYDNRVVVGTRECKIWGIDLK